MKNKKQDEKYEKSIIKYLENVIPIIDVLELIVSYFHFQGICRETIKCVNSSFMTKDRTLILSDGRVASCTISSKQIEIFKSNNYKFVDRIITLRPKRCKEMKLLPDDLIVVRFCENILQIFNPTNGNKIASMRFQFNIISINIESNDIINVLMKNNGNVFIKAWNFKTGHVELVSSIVSHDFQWCYFWSREKLIECYDNGEIKIRNVVKDIIETQLIGYTYNAYLFLPISNETLASCHLNVIKIWNLDNGKCIKTLTGHKFIVDSLDLLPDGRLVSASYGDSIKIWNLENGKCDLTLTEDTDSIKSVRVLPDGTLMSSSMDKQIKLWI